MQIQAIDWDFYEIDGEYSVNMMHNVDFYYNESTDDIVISLDDIKSISNEAQNYLDSLLSKDQQNALDQFLIVLDRSNRDTMINNIDKYIEWRLKAIKEDINLNKLIGVTGIVKDFKVKDKKSPDYTWNAVEGTRGDGLLRKHSGVSSYGGFNMTFQSECKKFRRNKCKKMNYQLVLNLRFSGEQVPHLYFDYEDVLELKKVLSQDFIDGITSTFN